MRRFFSVLMVLFAVALVAPIASAQSDTLNVPLTMEAGSQHCWYLADIVLSAVEDSATYETKAFPILDMTTDGLTWLINPGSDTVKVDIDVSMDLQTWYALGLTATDTVVASTWTTSTDAGLKGARYARFDVGWPSGSTQTVKLAAKVPLQSYLANKPGNCKTYNGN